MTQVVLLGVGSEEKAMEEAELDEDEQQCCGKHGQEVAVSIQMKIVRFYFPPLSMFPMLENTNVTFSCWHVSCDVSCGGRATLPPLLRCGVVAGAGGPLFLPFAVWGAAVGWSGRLASIPFIT